MDMEQRVGALEVAVARHEERLESLESYQKKQNGSIQRIESKIDKLYFWLFGICGGLILDLSLRLVGR